MNLSQYPVYTVSQINGYLKDLMDGDPFLGGLLIRGEISNYKCYPSGHHYFSLKDEKGSMRCVMFRGDAVRLRFRPANGQSVVAYGRVTVYPRDGQYQLYCTQLIEDGRGALDLAFEQLRSRLEQEGLFDPATKKPLPQYPKKIALVTSPAGAAVRDMLRILAARWPMTQVVVVPVRVQGQGSAQEIADALDEVNRRGGVDLIITGRGGGSREDLWAFNEEPVARAIARSVIPVISAVGHEPDVTIADYVADLRAATPSNAAELAVPDRVQERARLGQLSRRLAAGVSARLQVGRKDLERLRSNRVLRLPRGMIDDRRLALDGLQRRLVVALEGSLQRGRTNLARLSAGLDAMSPLKVLGRGYAIARREGQVITSVSQIEVENEIEVLVRDGLLRCRVKEKEERGFGREEKDL